MTDIDPTSRRTPHGPDLRIRRLTYADLPQVVSVERRAFPTPWSLAMFVLELSKPGGCCLVALRGGVVVGYLVCSRFDTVYHVMNVAVDPALRRRGTGRALLQTLLDTIADPDARYTLEVRPSNLGAIQLYHQLGFLGVGHRPRYYQDNGEDALIMWRTRATLQGQVDDVPNAGPVTPA